MKSLLILVFVGVILFAPFATIASLNTLFSLSIPYDVYTWLSVAWLSALFGGSAYARNSK